MKKVITIISVMMLCFGLTACANSNPDVVPNSQEEAPADATQPTDCVDSDMATTMDLLVMVGDQTFSAKLYQNQTTQTLAEGFPLNIEMNDMNGNEKYYYLPQPLPTNPEQPEEIHAGEIILYGDDCLVVFYESFANSYQYNRLGYIKDATGFAQAVGTGNAQITFDLINNPAQ